MHNYIVFNGKNSVNNFGLVIDQLPESAHASRHGDLYQIAGRNGTFVHEDGTFENYEQVYDVNFIGNAFSKGRDVATWLLGSRGYCRLEDSYEPDFYRLARYAGPLNIENVLQQGARASIVFDCRPERYLKSGETAITAMSNVYAAQSPSVTYDLVNPTGQVARPIIRVTGQGGIRFAVTPANASADVVIEMAIGTTTTTVTVIIDCETYTVTDTSGNDMSSRVSFVDQDGYPEFPKLQSGVTVVKQIPFNGGGYIQSLEIVPRWWSL